MAFRLETTPDNYTRAEVLRFFTDVLALDRYAPVELARLRETTPGVYEWRLELVDGRVWGYSITFAAGEPTNPQVTLVGEPVGTWGECVKAHELLHRCIEVKLAAQVTLLKLSRVG